MFTIPEACGTAHTYTLVGRGDGYMEMCVGHDKGCYRKAYAPHQHARTCAGSERLCPNAISGEEVVTKESFVSICWRLIPYWFNAWEQQWGAECSRYALHECVLELPLLLLLIRAALMLLHKEGPCLHAALLFTLKPVPMLSCCIVVCMHMS